ncbi:hypothetical protein F5Y13DRAFT_187113 [Hypoxylon sp. FL1857]|nr:hypothetical protein F5Y13DRAFT_187113 [Hypoxylon sp. FL1857]
MASESIQNCGYAECKKTTESTSLHKCTRCKKVAYCNKECQTKAWPAHKKNCRRQNYIIKTQLSPGEVTDPPVFRTLSCPAHITFFQLHIGLQIAFGWALDHSFDFAVLNPDAEEPEHVQTQAEGRDASVPYPYLFHVINTWGSVFSDGDLRPRGKTHPNNPEKQADACVLHQLFDDPLYQGRQIIYTYNFASPWKHHMTITGRAEATDEFVCLHGAGHGVAEDVGGVQGWADLKAAYRAANPSPDQRMRRHWFENICLNGDPVGLAGYRVNVWDKEVPDLIFQNKYICKKFKPDYDGIEKFLDDLRRSCGVI